MTGTISSVIASRGKAWFRKNVVISWADVGTQVTDSVITMAQAMRVGIALVYLLVVILVRLLLMFLVILRALPLAVFGAFVALAVTGHATNIITGSAVSLQDAVLPATAITAGMWIAYSVGDGIYGVALAATAMLSAVMLTSWSQ